MGYNALNYWVIDLINNIFMWCDLLGLSRLCGCKLQYAWTKFSDYSIIRIGPPFLCAQILGLNKCSGQWSHYIGLVRIGMAHSYMNSPAHIPKINVRYTFFFHKHTKKKLDIQ